MYPLIFITLLVRFPCYNLSTDLRAVYEIGEIPRLMRLKDMTLKCTVEKLKGARDLT
jgi:hypothetical protein